MDTESLSEYTETSQEVEDGERQRRDDIPTLHLSKSLLEDLPKTVTQPYRIPIREKHRDSGVSPTQVRLSLDAKLPHLKESTSIPRKTDRHRGKNREPSCATWEVYPRTDWRDNTIDTKTIYSREKEQLLQTLADDNNMLSPLDSSPRVAANVPDSQDLHEKVLVMKHYFSVGIKGHYQADRAVLPTVYTDFFSCPDRKKKYINSLWLEHFKNRQKQKPDCWQYGSKDKNSRKKKNCTYCDVMGSRYCSFCQEFKNRNFALTYEENYLPAIGGLRRPRKQVGSTNGSQEKRSSAARVKPKGKKRGHEKGNEKALLLPITYIPQDTRH